MSRAAVRAPSTAALLALALLASAGCESGFNRNDAIVSTLRILGARAEVQGQAGDWADAEVGDTVALSALVANPEGLPDVTVTWLTCLPTDVDATTPCQDEGILRDPPTLIGMNGVLTLGVGETVDVPIPSEAQPLLDAVLARADQQTAAECALFVEVPMVVIAHSDSAGETFTAMKNLRLSPYDAIAAANDPNYHYPRNANPSIDALVLNPPDDTACVPGQTLTTACATDADCGGASCVDGWCPAAPFPDGPQTLCGHIPDAATQTITRCGINGPIDDEAETTTITWYASGGNVGAGVSRIASDSLGSRTYTGYQRPVGAFTVYGVVRDGRDGEDWAVQEFQ